MAVRSEVRYVSSRALLRKVLFLFALETNYWILSYNLLRVLFFFFFQAEDGIRDYKVTGVQTCALPIFQQCCAAKLPAHRGRAGADGRGELAAWPRSTVGLDDHWDCGRERGVAVAFSR